MFLEKGELPETSETLEIEVELMDTLVGSDSEDEIENIKEKEPLMLNIGTGKTAGFVTELGKTVTIDLKLPVCAEEDDRVCRLTTDRFKMEAYRSWKDRFKELENHAVFIDQTIVDGYD